MKQTMIRLTAVVLAAVMFVTLPAVQGLSHYAVSDQARGIGDGALPETERGADVAVSAGIPVIVGEETSRRGENTVHFRTSDGGYIAGIYGTAVSYQDGEGSWRAIDNSMAYDAVRGVYHNKENPFRAEFPELFDGEGEIRISKEGYEIRMTAAAGTGAHAGLAALQAGRRTG